MCPGIIAFFFSSRRRHTRYIGDWSSDVCSSDLIAEILKYTFNPKRQPLGASIFRSDQRRSHKIGRASCRERVKNSVVEITGNKRRIKKYTKRILAKKTAKHNRNWEQR